jgi:hypothetical protein
MTRQERLKFWIIAGTAILLAFVIPAILRPGPYKPEWPIILMIATVIFADHSRKL